jgi:hypothetical protein
MHKLVNVLRVSELEPGQAVERELRLITVTAPAADATEVLLSLAESSACASPTSARGDRLRGGRRPDHVDAFVELPASARIKELARPAASGLARLGRGTPRPQATREHLAKGSSWRPSTTSGHLDPALRQGRPVLGFGSQGHDHALNLHDSGVDVMVGPPARAAPPGTRRGSRAGCRDCRRGGRGRAARPSLLPTRAA